MAGKRSATSELNSDNWDQEDENEEAGHYQSASSEVLQTRVIKSAKRRITNQSKDNNLSTNIFSGFTGFAKNNNNSAPTSSTTSLFSFLSKTNSDSQQQGITNGVTTKSMKNEATNNESEKETSEKRTSTDYYAKLKGLNESVSQWIKTHVDANPICNLTPIFKDYEKYLKEISDSDTQHESESDNNKITFNLEKSDSNIKTSASTFSFLNQKDSDVKSLPLSSIQFGVPKETDSKSSVINTDSKTSPFVTPFSNTATFSFGNKDTTTSNEFSFGGGAKPFTFANVTPATTEQQQQQDDDNESDEPPKADFTPVVEDGSIYNIKCKLFVKKESEFVERGVGQLYLKPIDASDKTQLIVRADTNLGNLLMNVILSKSIPLSRKGKNNVMIVCVPTPEEGAKKTDDKIPLQTILIKVKTAEDADKLFDMLEKYKK